MDRYRLGMLALAVAMTLACGEERRSSVGFRMPAGDPKRGEAVFVSLRCNDCHRVAGAQLPSPVADPPVPVVLGGETFTPRTDGELVAAIIHPSHRLAGGYRPEQVASGGLSRMGDFNESMTVRDLVDVVAFLQSRYVVRPPPPPMQ